jgi:hypothetical protein
MPSRWSEQFCRYLGRRIALARLLDRVARWIVPLPPPLQAGAAAGGSRANSGLPAHIVAMATGPETRTVTPNTDDWTFRGDAPTAPHGAHGGEHRKTRVIYDAPWWKFWETDIVTTNVERGADICRQDKYRGMHGTPCLYAGGSDIHCPRGTVSGWFWSYRTPAGVYFYVDCCGGAPGANSVWCNWTSENNWCFGGGRTQNTGGSTTYNCTLAIPDSLMVTKLVPGKRPEVVGVD